LTELKLEAKFVSHPNSLARWPIDPAMGNSFGSYAEQDIQHNYRAEASPMGQDDDLSACQLRQKAGWKSEKSQCRAT